MFSLNVQSEQTHPTLCQLSDMFKFNACPKKWWNPAGTRHRTSDLMITCGGLSCQGNPRWSASGSVGLWTNKQANKAASPLRLSDPQTDESENTKEKQDQNKENNERCNILTLFYLIQGFAGSWSQLHCCLVSCFFTSEGLNRFFLGPI